MRRYGFGEEYHIWWRQTYLEFEGPPVVETVAAGVLLPNGRWAIGPVSSRQTAMDDLPDLAGYAAMRCIECGNVERHDNECVYQDYTWDFGVAAYVGVEFT
jgi:hypothetical protein